MPPAGSCASGQYKQRLISCPSRDIADQRIQGLTLLRGLEQSLNTALSDVCPLCISALSDEKLTTENSQV